MFVLTLAITLFVLYPAINANQNVNTIPLQNGQISLQELLASSNGQPLIVLIAPQSLLSSQRLLGGKALQLPTGNQLLVEAPVQPVQVHYKSQSIPLNVQHTHIPAPTPETKLSRSEEEPHKIIHEVIRPVIQEVREIIQPYRRIIQEIRPVQESVVSQVSIKQNKAEPAPTEA